MIVIQQWPSNEKLGIGIAYEQREEFCKNKYAQKNVLHLYKPPLSLTANYLLSFEKFRSRAS